MSVRTAIFVSAGALYMVGLNAFLIWGGRILRSLPQDEEAKARELKSQIAPSPWFMVVVLACWALFPIERMFGMGLCLIIFALHHVRRARKMLASARTLEVDARYVRSQKLFFAFKIVTAGIAGVLMFSLGVIQGEKDVATLRRHQPLSNAER